MTANRHRIARLLVANRGEIAIRVMRAAKVLEIESVAIHSEDDRESLHVRSADGAHALAGTGAAAYLDGAQIVAAARATGCDAVHPGYGFLSENADFARRCREAGLTFVGPRTELLELFGDKIRARDAAARAGVPVLDGTAQDTSLEAARAFFAKLPKGESMIVKAVAGGGGRGVRIVASLAELEAAYPRCRSEAMAAFGNDAVYVERLVRRARHIEVQILGDGDAVTHLYERDCSVQRRHQKLIEIAPAPHLPPRLRDRVVAAAVELAKSVGYDNIGTFEFLIDAARLSDASPFAFIEANPRLQVEHTVTEAVTGVDIVVAQIELAAGARLESLALAQRDVPPPRGFAIQARVNMETIGEDGAPRPSGGTLAAFEIPSGPGVRTDTFGFAGYTTSPRFDSLLAKVIGHSPRAFADAAKRTERALAEMRIDGVATNVGFLRAVLADLDFIEGRIYTRFVDEHAKRFVEKWPDAIFATERMASGPVSTPLAGVKVDRSDPLAVLSYGQAEAQRRRTQPTASETVAAGLHAIGAPLQGTIVAIDAKPEQAVRNGDLLLVMESMKMEHEIRASVSGIVREIRARIGDAIYEGHTLVVIEPAEIGGDAARVEERVDLDAIRPDLKQVLDRLAATRDENRPAAVARRRAKNQRTARENVLDLCDPGSFVEYGPLAVAAQAARRSLEELIEKSPADGMITGIGRVNGDLFAEPASRCAVMAYDYTVFAGTQGSRNHRKTDRMIQLAEEGRMPMVLFAEGGGGRPGDTEGGAGGSVGTFASFPRLSGLVPIVGITSGRCFAGNASLLGCCDVVIATADSNIGMGGPAMIEGGGLGVFAPEDIGAMDVQVPNGVVDIAVTDEAEAVRVAKRYLAYFQGAVAPAESADQRLMRRIIPENRLRVYDVRKIVETIADTGSVLELRPKFGIGMITALVRIEGRALGIIANNPAHLGGAIDSDGADKASRFMQICDAFDVPLLFLCDTPGIMVGPEIEKTALVRHSSRMFLTGANLSVPFFTIILRKAYGLGAIAMAGGSYAVPYFAVAWPTGEFGGMGLEGSVKLGYREDLAKIDDPAARRALYEKMVARAYERGKALASATTFHVDDTIDPADSRRWVASLLSSVRPPPPRAGKKRPFIDAW